jgi:hypothetical protein
VVTAGSNQLSVSWQSLPGADQYEVFCGTGTNPPASPVQTVSSASTTITGLTGGTTYNVWVRGKNSTGVGAMSATASAKPIGNMGAVTLTAGNNQLTASWTTVTGADQYEVYCGTSTTMPGTPAQTVSAVSAAITGLTNGTTYYVWVKPKNANGTGTVSTRVSAKPIGNMGAVTLVAGNGQLTASWTAVAGADQYEMYYSTITTMPGSPAKTVSTTSATITGLTNGTTYYVWIKPKNANGTGTVGTWVNAKPIGNMGVVTLIPGNLKLTASWTAVAGADQYEVYYDTTTTIPGIPAQTVSTTSATITGLNNGTIYYVWVKPKNANDTGGVSTMVSGKPGFSEDFGSDAIIHNVFDVYSATDWQTTRTSINNGGDDKNYVITVHGTVMWPNPGYGTTFTPDGLKILIQGNSDGTLTRSSNETNLNLYEKTQTIIIRDLTLNGGYTSPMITASGPNARVEMKGNATITGSYGGGVYVSNGTFIMNDNATINNNRVTASAQPAYGGGVRIMNGNFIMNGGTISGNIANSTDNTTHGGGVYIVGGTFTMNGGIIRGNTATSQFGDTRGGGVYIGAAAFIKTGGIIYGKNEGANSNTITRSSFGYAVFCYSSGSRARDTTAGTGVRLYYNNGSMIDPSDNFDTSSEWNK